MGTNLHNIRFPSTARSQRIKSLLDLRKKQRSQVFRSHRLRHFLATNDRIRLQFHVICQHLDAIDGYNDDEKLTALLLIMIGQTPSIVDFIRIELATKLMQHINNEFNVLISAICCMTNEIDASYLGEQMHSIGVRFERDNLTFCSNINSISNLMVELLSQLLHNFCQRCQCDKMTITKDMLSMFELCYQYFQHNHTIIERNLHTIFALTQGNGRFQRSKTIVEYEPLMQRLMNQQHSNNATEALIILKILNSITKGFAENIEHLLRLNLLGHLRNQLIDGNRPSYDTVEQCLCILENICGNHRSDIQAVIDADLIAPLINVFKSTDSDINLRTIGVNIFYSISMLGSIEQIKILLNFDLLRLLCCQLHYQANFNEDVIETILDLMNNILREFYRKDHSAHHRVAAVIKECGGFMAISQLISHSNESISNVALQLNQYNSNICAHCNQVTSTATFEHMQQ